MSINNNSYSTNTNISFGSKDLDNLWLQAQSCNIPGISLSHPKIGGRAGVGTFLQADNVTYTDLIIDMKMDNKWEIYDILYKFFLDGLNVENGTFKSKKFDLWLDIHLGDGEVEKKFWYYNCRLMDISEIQLDSTDTEDTIITVSLVFQFDYMDYDNGFFKAKTES